MASLVVDNSLIVEIMSNDAEQARWTIYITGFIIITDGSVV